MSLQRKPNELYITRMYDAPIDLVWEAWTDPEQISQWWGPRGFTHTTHSKDLRPGGTWVYTMHGPDGRDYPNLTTYHEVEKPSRLVYDHGASEGNPPLFRVTVRFEELEGKTKMDMTMALETPEAAKEIEQFIREAGGNTTWDRLGEHLAQKHGKDQFVINRTFEASLDHVFGMWTQPEHFFVWLPPKDAKIKFYNGEIKTGSETFYCMEGSFGTLYGKSNYLGVLPNKRIVYTQQFCDKDQNIIRHPMAPTWPETMQCTVLFESEDALLTRVTVVSQVYGNASEEERDTFFQAKSDMTQGWTGSFDKLEKYLLE